MVREDPLWQDGNDYPARLDRQFIEDVFDVEGVLTPSAGGLLVAPRGAGTNMSVDVAAGRAVIRGDDESNQGCYRVISTATENLPIGAAPGSDSRIDLVVARVRDANVTGGVSSDWILEVIPGAVAAVPVAPAVPNTAIPLAQVLVAAGTASITAGEITDLRTAAGSTLFLTEASASAALAGKLDVTGKAADSELLDGLNSTAFQTRDEKGSANGYASLGADGKVPTAQLPAGGAPTFVRKTANETLFNSTTAQADDQLSFAVAAGETWIFEVVLYPGGDGAIDIKCGMQAPTGSVGRYGAHGLDQSATTNDLTEPMRAQTDTTFGGTAPLVFANSGVIVIWGHVIVGGTGGTVDVIWAQNTSSGNGLSVIAGSHLVAQKVA